ncbi:FHA domain-containing protein [Epidermidibacterium keratini]|uniref:FHA domain-containing protein n=1 Tax=Epidermidibacterium keratini TaxID=1891644 RepID=A0A7L4YRR3_9ACTN|nr:FHA domain-containing protein [Epidermidibacterium keratini]QHC01752.1 FHA domain-containing protein [Epidermidibacterium keratini]
MTPGSGLVARHADSLVWVGDQISPETWEAIGTVLDLEPGTDPSGADTADRLSALGEALAADPNATFAALIIAGGQAQGILRGPVTVRNRDEIAPATGYEHYGITVPFGMSESVYVGNVNAAANAPGISEMLDLDAGIVPGGGAWAHPVSGGRRHSGATGTHSAAPSPSTGSIPAAGPAAATAEGLGAAGAAGALGAAGAAAGVAAAFGRADSPREDEAPRRDDPAREDAASRGDGTGEQLDSTMQYDPFQDGDIDSPTGASATSSPQPPAEWASPAQSPERPTPSTDSELGWPQPEPSQQARPVTDWLPDDSPAPVSSQAPPPPSPSTGEVRPDVRADAPLPPVEGSGGGWAAPVGFGTAAAAGGAAAGGAAAAGAHQSPGGFTPAPDHERVDLQSVSAPEPAQPLPPVDGAESAANSAQAGGPPGAQPAQQNAGVIVFDDGSTFALDRDYVIGRRPEKDSRVLSGQAAPLTVVDPDTVLSSAHALVTRRGDRVFLQDLGSLNGSHTASPGETDWTRLGAHEEVEIVPGTRLLFGWTVATFSGGNQQS